MNLIGGSVVSSVPGDDSPFRKCLGTAKLKMLFIFLTSVCRKAKASPSLFENDKKTVGKTGNMVC